MRHSPLFKLKGNKTLAAKIDARLFLQMRQFEPIVLGMLIHPFQPIRNPTTPSLHEANAQAWMSFQNSTQNQTRRRSHLFQRMRMQMEKAIAVKAFGASGRQPNTRADVDERRNLEFLGHAPERLIGRMIEVTVVDWVR